MSYFKVYFNGNGCGYPEMSMVKNGCDCYIYPNGNCSGMPLWSLKQTRHYTEVYSSGNMGGFSNGYFDINESGRLQFFTNGNGAGHPCYCIRIDGSSAYVYDSGNGVGCPRWLFRRNGNCVEFYDSGNGVGYPIGLIGEVSNIWDVIELAFLAFIIGFR